MDFLRGDHVQVENSKRPGIFDFIVLDFESRSYRGIRGIYVAQLRPVGYDDIDLYYSDNLTFVRHLEINQLLTHSNKHVRVVGRRLIEEETKAEYDKS